MTNPPAPFIFAGEFRGAKGDRGDIGHPGPAGPGTGVGAMVGAVLLSDTFQRSDRDLNGDRTDTGQTWTMNRPDADGVHLLVDGGYVPAIVPTSADYVRSFLPSRPRGIVADFSFTAGTTGAQNMVIGTAGATFINEDDDLTTSHGFGQGSVQLAVSPRIHTIEVADSVTADVHWWLFNPRSPLTDPYPSIMWGTFAADLPEDGTLLRAELWYDDDTRRVTVKLPDGSIHSTAPAGAEADLMETAAKYWGPMVGIQCRRPATTDGFVRFSRVAVHGVDVAAQQVVSGAILRFGNGAASGRTPPPLWTPDDLLAIAYITMDDWTPAEQSTVIAQWGFNGQDCFDFAIAGTGADIGKFRLLTTPDGDPDTDTFRTSTVAPGFTNGSSHWVAAYRTSADGAVRFYTSDDPYSTPVGSVTWTQLGTSVAGSAYAPFRSTGAAVAVGTRFNKANPMYGNLRFAGVYTATGGTSGTSFATAFASATAAADIDVRGSWSGTGANDARWVLDSVQWIATQASVDGLDARFLAVEKVDRFESHLLGIPVDQSATTSVTATSAAFYAGYQTITGGPQNSYITYRLGRALQGGTWSLCLFHHNASTRGIYTIAGSVDGTTFTDLTTVDGYAAGTGADRDVNTGVTVPDAVKYLRFKTATKNASSSGYTIGLSGISGIRTGA